ncbi:hypothetical protein AMTR_s00007p00115460 [Amborella trichopoda]|uniref:N-acetyltransferase domain-containing protein n=1 Tax=Amborella trichopoda TaxID=13333 RepID=W1PC42_AMBTC|nr:hypothetical protein AMTR_s00007p00115460 [Amborella trichopoda]
MVHILIKILDLGGFYTLILENEDDEMISVATIRVHREQIAELPLVGTSIKFQRQGMCHLLIDDLEKLLASLGVEKLLLPAAHQVKKFWENIGFQVMEKELIEEYVILNFQETTLYAKMII